MAGRNWFELELTSEFVPEHFPLELDTTPPTVTFGVPSSTNAGTNLIQTYVLEDAGIGWVNNVRLIDSNGAITVGTFDNDQIFISIPTTAFNGTATIEVDVEDDVGNIGIRSYQFNLTGGQTIDEHRGLSSGRPFTYGAGAPAWLKDKQEFAAEITLLRLTTASFNGSVELHRNKSFNFSGEHILLRSKVLELNCERAPAEHYLRLRQEDEELCLLMAD